MTVDISLSPYLLKINSFNLCNFYDSFVPSLSYNKADYYYYMFLIYFYKCRSYSIYYILLCALSAMGGVAAGVLDVLESQLPYNMWVPWDCTSFLVFWFTSLQEIVALIIATILNVATETIILGFSLQMCAQFEILKHRLQRIVKHSEEEIFLNSNSLNTVSRKTIKLSEHVSHHLRIIRFVKQMIKLFYVRTFFLNKIY